MTTATKRYHPVPNPVDAFQRTYRFLMSRSDLDCLSALIDSGKVEVVIDMKHRSLTVLPQSQVEDFVNSVFKSLATEDAVSS